MVFKQLNTYIILPNEGSSRFILQIARQSTHFNFDSPYGYEQYS